MKSTMSLIASVIVLLGVTACSSAPKEEAQDSAVLSTEAEDLQDLADVEPAVEESSAPVFTDSATSFINDPPESLGSGSSGLGH